MGLFSKKKKKAPEPKPAPKSNATPPEQSEKVISLSVKSSTLTLKIHETIKCRRNRKCLYLHKKPLSYIINLL